MNHSIHCDCFDCKRRRRLAINSFCLGVLFACLVGLLVIALSGCSSTVTPAPVEVRQASYDQGEQNSGVLRLVDGGAIITEHARNRYNALVTIYGAELLPPIVRDYGITAQPDGTFLITNEALQKFVLLTAWHRMGRKPATK